MSAIATQRNLAGKYRAKVVDNTDPLGLARLQLEVPDALGRVTSTWALPCMPFTGQSAGVFVLPAVGARVWVEFEHGDPDYPVWTGGFWESRSELPQPAQNATPGTQTFVVATTNGTTLQLSDAPGPTGGIVLKTQAGAKIEINDTGITIDNGKGAKIALSTNSVTVNDGALVVQ